MKPQITFKGKAAAAAFTAMTGVQVPSMSAPTNSRKTVETDRLQAKIAGLPRRMGDQMIRDHCRSMERQRDEARELLSLVPLDALRHVGCTTTAERIKALLTPKPTP